MPAQTFTISELAKEFDLTTRAIRFYEDMGLITPERAGLQRVYSARDRARLLLTLRAKRLVSVGIARSSSAACASSRGTTSPKSTSRGGLSVRALNTGKPLHHGEISPRRPVVK